MVTKSHRVISSSRLLLNQSLTKLSKPPINHLSRNASTFPPFPTNQTPAFSFTAKSHYSTAPTSKVVQDLMAQMEMEKQKEREQKKRAGLDTSYLDKEDEEDYMGVGALLEKIEMSSVSSRFVNEPTDSDSDEEDERFSTDAVKTTLNMFTKKHKRHAQLLKNFVEAKTLDATYKCMKKVDKFEQRHFALRPEYRVIGELMNRLKVAEGKDKFVLQHKINRALRLVEWKETHDPNNPSNYGVIKQEGGGREDESLDALSDDEEDALDGKEKGMEEFDDMKEMDTELIEKINEIDKKLEEKLAELDYTFGRKGKRLEEEIRVLADERNDLTEKKRRPLYRKGFDVKMINVNRTCKVTKGGRIARYTAMVACGNYQGVVGFGKARATEVPVAVQKAYEKCFQNLHYVERHEDHTIAHAVQTEYKKTKIYLWPASARTGVVAGKTVETVLKLAGFKNIKTKVIGPRNPQNTVKAILKALNAVQTPKDVEEKFGRTVIEKYLL